MKRKVFTASITAVLLALGLSTSTVANADNLEGNSSQILAKIDSGESKGNDSATIDSQKKSSINKSDYLWKNPKIIRLNKTTTLYKDANLTKVAIKAKSGSHYLISSLTKNSDGIPVLKTRSGFIIAKKNLIKKIKGYQNPKAYHQVHYTQVKPYGKVGYNLYRGYEGIKTWKVMHRMGTWYGTNYYNQATYNAVKNFQRNHYLPVTGNVDLKTWQKMGFSKSSWYGIDSYIAPLQVQAWQGRSAHIEAMIKQAYKYMGKPWLVGCSSSPNYGVDCSGLVMQSLYAGGISPIPTSSIGHAHPGNEWNSRNLWADKHLKRVPYSQRRRGDLVFYYQPGTRTIWHIAIYLGNNRVIESWPPCVMVQPIVNGQRNVIAGIKRPFI